MTRPPDAEDRFWQLAEPLLARPGVTRSTMMGLPCLRLHGAFFASCDRRTGDLLVKLPEARVGDLVGAGTAHAFAPAGGGSGSGPPSRPDTCPTGSPSSTRPRASPHLTRPHRDRR
jgi:hypothetical protein